MFAATTAESYLRTLYASEHGTCRSFGEFRDAYLELQRQYAIDEKHPGNRSVMAKVRELEQRIGA